MTMIKIRLLQGAVLRGSVWPRDSVTEAEVEQARALVEDGKAEALDELPPRQKTPWELALEAPVPENAPESVEDGA